MKWSNELLQVLERPVCPHCKTTEKPILVRSETRDDATWQRCVCRECSKRFQRVYENPCQVLAKRQTDIHA